MADEYLTSAAYGKVVKQAWTDPQFKAKLLADPSASLAAAGVPVPLGVTVKLVEDTDKVIHLVLPLRPGADDLDDAALDLVAGGLLHIVSYTSGCAPVAGSVSQRPNPIYPPPPAH